VPLLFNGSELATTSGLGLDEGILTSRPSNYVEARYSLQPNGKDWILTLIDGEAVVVINDPANLQNNPTAVLDGMLCHFRVRAVGPKRWGLEGWIEPSSH
jgi:hypothetical protein